MVVVFSSFKKSKGSFYNLGTKISDVLIVIISLNISFKKNMTVCNTELVIIIEYIPVDCETLSAFFPVSPYLGGLVINAF